MSPEQPNEAEVQGRRTSLLQKVRENLLTDERVFFAGEILHTQEGFGYLETVDIIVSPVEPIYDPNKLNKFMDGLVSGIPRSAREGARHRGDKSDFALGKLHFYETLGETIRKISITTTAVEPEPFNRAGVQIGKSHETEKESFERKTWVIVYPDSSSAQIIAEYVQGFEDGTVEQNRTFDYMRHWFSAEQFKEIKKLRKTPPIRHLELLTG